jgi:hypothetical protein
VTHFGAARSRFRMLFHCCSRGAMPAIYYFLARQMHFNMLHAASGIFFPFMFHLRCDSLSLRADHFEACLTYLISIQMIKVSGLFVCLTLRFAHVISLFACLQLCCPHLLYWPVSLQHFHGFQGKVHFSTHQLR